MLRREERKMENLNGNSIVETCPPLVSARFPSTALISCFQLFKAKRDALNFGEGQFKLGNLTDHSFKLIAAVNVRYLA